MAFRCTPGERKLICEMAAWSGMSRQDYIIAKLTDAQVEVRIGERSEGVEGLDVEVVQGGASGGLRHRRHLRDGTRVEPSARPPTPCSQAIRRDRRCYPRPKTLFPRRRPSSQGRQAHGLQRAVQHKVHLEHVDRGLAEDAQESALGALGDDLAHLVFALARGFRQARYLVLGGIGGDLGVEP